MVTSSRHNWSRQVYHIDPPQLLSVISLAIGCIKRVENYINIAKQCIHKAAGSRINEMVFSRYSWRYLMFIIYETGLEKYTPKKSMHPTNLCTPFSPLHIALCQLSVLGFPCFFTTHHKNCFALFFTLEIEKSLTLTCIRLCVTGISVRDGCRTLWILKM